MIALLLFATAHLRKTTSQKMKDIKKAELNHNWIWNRSSKQQSAVQNPRWKFNITLIHYINIS